MSHDVTNFLPSDKLRAFRRGYFLRVGTLAVFLLVFLVVTHGVLLIPAYLYAQDLKSQAEAQLSARSLEALGEEHEGITGRIELLETAAKTLIAFLAPTTATERFESILALPTLGITLSSLSVDQNRMRITGSAVSREALREYHLALSALPFVAQADLPLSSYAKETDIVFAIDISIQELP